MGEIEEVGDLDEESDEDGIPKDKNDEKFDPNTKGRGGGGVKKANQKQSVL